MFGILATYGCGAKQSTFVKVGGDWPNKTS